MMYAEMTADEAHERDALAESARKALNDDLDDWLDSGYDRDCDYWANTYRGER